MRTYRSPHIRCPMASGDVVLHHLLDGPLVANAVTGHNSQAGDEIDYAVFRWDGLGGGAEAAIRVRIPTDDAGH